nr:receptor-like kinase TMK4 [Ipomoea batatas]GME10380.1 receptor-like kinase TMK4 [Ipomoea batatas]
MASTASPPLHLSLFIFVTFISVAFSDDAAVMSKLLAALSPPPSGWSASAPFCTWTNVNCDKATGNVVSINLDSKSVSGTLPSDITRLSSLQTLSVQKNSLAGELPSFANMSNLQQLYLDNNQFSSVPQDFLLGLPKLQTFSISENGNLGPWQIPSYLTASTNLNSFYASNASIFGSIPDFFDSFPNLQNFRLSYNNFTGSLPGSLANSEIQNLWLNNQKQGLTGTIDVLSSMTQLSQVWLHANAFSGPIPDLSKCTNLFDLQLRDNQFTGVIPDSLMSLPNLQNITLQNNKLQGPKPQFKDGVSATLGPINSFCKDTPGPCDPQVTTLLAVAGGLGYPISLADSWEGNDACKQWTFVTCDPQQQNVITVNLGRQHFPGTISPAFANLTALRNLYLNDNNLTGSIPESLTTLPKLQVLDVTNNNLSGPIPVFPSSVKFSYGGNLLLGKNGTSGGGGGGSPGGSNSSGPSGSPSHGSSGSSVSPGMIAGVVIAVIIFVLVVLFVSYKCYMKRRHKRFGRVESPEKSNQMVKTSVVGGVTCVSGYAGVPNELQSQSSGDHSEIPVFEATGRVTTKVDVYAFGVVLMEIITGRKALDETMPDERSHLVTWFRRVLINKDNLRKAIDPNLDPDDETYESIFKVAELAGHCTAREPLQRPEMGHAVNVLGPLVEQWKPSRPEEDESYGIDLHMSLPQALQRWQADEGTSRMFDDFSYSQSQSSIPSKPSGFADSFNSTDCR